MVQLTPVLDPKLEHQYQLPAPDHQFPIRQSSFCFPVIHSCSFWPPADSPHRHLAQPQWSPCGVAGPNLQPNILVPAVIPARGLCSQSVHPFAQFCLSSNSSLSVLPCACAMFMLSTLFVVPNGLCLHVRNLGSINRILKKYFDPLLVEKP